MADSRESSIVPAQDALLVMDEDGRVADWNPRAEAIFGWGRNEALGHELAELIIPERFRAAHSQGFRRFLKTGQAALLNRSIELVALRRDGTDFPLEVTIAEVGSGDVRRFAARARDLSERERTEHELKDVSRTAGDSHAVSETADERPARLEPPTDGRAVRILLAEDSDDNSFLVKSYLRGTPCVVEVAENGAVALAKFKRERYDLVLMDMGMPVMDGYATVGEMRRFERENERRPTPIVALTAYALPENFERTRAAGCDSYLTKPVRKTTLLDMIREFTHGFR